MNSYIFILLILSLYLLIGSNKALNELSSDCTLKTVRISLNLISSFSVVLFITCLTRLICKWKCKCEIDFKYSHHITNILLLLILFCSITILTDLRNKCDHEFTNNFSVFNIFIALLGFVGNNYVNLKKVFKSSK